MTKRVNSLKCQRTEHVFHLLGYQRQKQIQKWILWIFNLLYTDLCPRPPSLLRSSESGSKTLLSQWSRCPGSRRFSETLKHKHRPSMRGWHCPKQPNLQLKVKGSVAELLDTHTIFFRGFLLFVLGWFLQFSRLLNTPTFARNITDEVPSFNEVGLFALQLDNALIRSLLKLLILVKALLRLLFDEEKIENRRQRVDVRHVAEINGRRRWQWEMLVSCRQTDRQGCDWLCKRPADHWWAGKRSSSRGTYPAGGQWASQTGSPSLPHGSTWQQTRWQY